MPIATPEVYAEMLDAAKNKSFAYPAINVSSSQTLNAALKGFADAGSDGIIQVSTGGAEYLSGPSVKNMVAGASAFAAYAAEVARRLPREHRAAHRPLPEGQARRLRAPAARAQPGAGRPRRGAAVPVAHVGRLGRAAGGEPADRRGAAGEVHRRADRPGDRGRRRRRRGGRRRERDQRQALLHARGRHRHREGARPRRPRLLHDRADLRQRARRLQAGQRQAAPRRAEDGAGGGGAGVRARAGQQAVPPGLPRRLRLDRARRSARPSTTAW